MIHLLALVALTFQSSTPQFTVEKIPQLPNATDLDSLQPVGIARNGVVCMQAIHKVTQWPQFTYHMFENGSYTDLPLTFNDLQLRKVVSITRAGDLVGDFIDSEQRGQCLAKWKGNEWRQVSPPDMMHAFAYNENSFGETFCTYQDKKGKWHVLATAARSNADTDISTLADSWMKGIDTFDDSTMLVTNDGYRVYRNGQLDDFIKHQDGRIFGRSERTEYIGGTSANFWLVSVMDEIAIYYQGALRKFNPAGKVPMRPRQVGYENWIVGTTHYDNIQYAILWTPQRSYNLNDLLVGYRGPRLTSADFVGRDGDIIAEDGSGNWYLARRKKPEQGG